MFARIYSKGNKTYDFDLVRDWMEQVENIGNTGAWVENASIFIPASAIYRIEIIGEEEDAAWPPLR